MVNINIEAKGLGVLLSRLEKIAIRGKNIRPMLNKLGEIMVEGVTENFEKEGRPKKWKARSPLTNQIYSGQAYDHFVNNTAKGQSMKWNSLMGNKKSTNALSRHEASISSKTSSGMILNKNAKLKQSIDKKVVGNSVIVGSALPYARIHQLGGVIRPKNKKYLCIPIGNGQFIFLKKAVIPARPYLVITEKEEKLMADDAKQFILEDMRENR